LDADHAITRNGALGRMAQGDKAGLAAQTSSPAVDIRLISSRIATDVEFRLDMA